MTRGLGWVLALSAALKLALAVSLADLEPRYDETEWVRFAHEIAEEGAEPRLWRAPLYQWFLAGAVTLGGGRPVGARIAQVVLSVLATWLVFRTGSRLAGPRAALAAAAFVAFYPSHVAFSHLLWSETLYGFLLLVALDRLLAADGGQKLGAAAWAGAALGLAALTRSVGLALLAVSVAWLASGKGGRRPALIAALAAALVVTPWSWRASMRAGELVITDVNGPFNVWSGNNAYIPDDVQGIWALGLPLENGLQDRFLLHYPDDAFRREVPRRLRDAGVQDAQGPDGAAWYRREALQEIRGDPTDALRRVPRKLAALWAPDFFLPRHLLRDWYGPVPPPIASGLTLVTWVAAIVPLLLGPVALVALPSSRFRSLAALWVAAYLAIHAVAYGHSRLHQPLVPVLVLAATACAARGLPSGRKLLPGAAVAALVIAGWVSVWPLLGGLYIHPGPRHAGAARALAAGRELSLPGAHRQVWMLAGVEASRGRDGEAARLIDESRHADRAWSHVLRALVAGTPTEAERFLDRALEREPGLEAARDLKRRLAADAR